MPKIYLIRDSVASDCSLIHGNLRSGDALESALLGFNPKRGVWQSYRRSLYRKTAFIEGEIAAMWGLGGCPLGASAMPWLVTTPIVESMPVAFVREGRAALDEMLSLCPKLQNEVLTSYRQAVRFLEILGFTLSEPRPYGPKGALFQTFTLER